MLQITYLIKTAMLSARSMYFGGEIVEAIDVNLDFDSYKELGLLCPFCSEPVFLCGETVRQSSKTKKLSYIQPHFKHFPGGDPMDLDCEKRFFTPEGKRYLEAIRSERRGQRLDLFNRYFWDMVRDGTSKCTPSSKVPKSAIPLLKKIGLDMDALEQETRLLHKEMGQGLTVVRRWVKKYFSEIFDDQSDWRLNKQCTKFTERLTREQVEKTKKAQSEHLDFIKYTSDLRINQMIVLEAIEFLSTRKGYPAFREMACWLWYEKTWLVNDLNKPLIIENNEMLDIQTMMLCSTNWQQQLEEKAKLKESSRGRGFANLSRT